MNIYSRALRHIDMNDVKQKHHKKLVEKRIHQEKYKKFIEELTYKNSPFFSNWRESISEQMTSDGMLQTTLVATGDTILFTSETNLSYGPDSIPGFYGVGNGDNYDTRYYDTLLFDVSAGNGPLSLLLYPSNQGGSYVEYNIFTSPTSGTFSVPIPPNLRTKSMNATWFTGIPYETTGYGNWTISNIRFQRRAPMNVFVSLDSPEATAFIRTDPAFSGLSEEEKKEKLRKMLEASDEYLAKIFGKDFPGSGVVPPGESGTTPGVQVTDIPTPKGIFTSPKSDAFMKGWNQGRAERGLPPMDNMGRVLDQSLQPKDVPSSTAVSPKTPETKSITPKQQSMIDRAKSYDSSQLDDQMKDFAKQVSSMDSTRRSNLAKSYHARAVAQMESQARGEFSWDPAGELATSIRAYELLSGQKFDGKPLTNYFYVDPKNSNQPSPPSPTPTPTPDPKDPKEMSDAELAKSGYYRGSDGKIYPISGLKDKPTPYDAADPVNVAFNAILARLGLGAAKSFMDWANKGKNQRIPNEDAASLEKLWADDAAQRGQSDAAFARGDKPGFFGRPDQAFNPFRPASKGGPGSGPTPIIRQLVGRSTKPGISASNQSKGTKQLGARGTKPGMISSKQFNKRVQRNSYEPEGQLISERRKLKSPEEVLNKLPGYYDGKPSPLGFPMDPPPETINGYHPDLVDGKKIANRFNRLDTISAKAMPLTGNPHIDKKIKAARKRPK